MENIRIRDLNIEEKEMVPFKDEIIKKPKLFVSDEENQYFKIGKIYAMKFSNDPIYKVASIIVKDKEIIGAGANSSKYHQLYGCRRKDKDGKPLYKTGEGYEVCPGCNPKTSHSEILAIKNSIIFNFLEELKNDERIIKKYENYIKKIKEGKTKTNLIYYLEDYEGFLHNIKNLIGEKKYNLIYSNIKSKLKGATLFLYGHFWACKTCWNYCKDYGIEAIIVRSNSFTLHKKR